MCMSSLQKSHFIYFHGLFSCKFMKLLSACLLKRFQGVFFVIVRETIAINSLLKLGLSTMNFLYNLDIMRLFGEVLMNWTSELNTHAAYIH